MRDMIQFNKFAKLHNGKNIFFCKTDYLLQLFAALKDYSVPSILISGNSDYAIVDNIVSQAPKCIKRWYAQNAETENPLVVGMPMGIENHENCILEGHGHGWPHAKEKIKILLEPPTIEASKDVYANFSLSTHPSRKMIHEICKRLDFVTTDVSISHSQINERLYSKYVDEILKHRMVVSPRGNGIDCHRIWEVLYLGRVPIIKKEQAIKHFKELPIIYLDSWEQLCNLNFLEAEWNKVKDNSKDMLCISYWENLILNEQKKHDVIK